jgi:hypothetical protein
VAELRCCDKTTPSGTDQGQSLEPPERTQWNVALEASAAILATNWEKSFYPHLDAFLSTTRSIPEIIQCCFGARRPGTKKGTARWAADCAVDKIRDRFGWDAIGYGSVALSISRSVPDEFRRFVLAHIRLTTWSG